MKEIWIKEIEGYEKCEGYKIREDGAIFSYKKFGGNSRKYIITDQPKLLKGYKNTKGYLLVDLGGFKRAIKVHRLIALAFMPNPNNKPQVNHIDGNKSNNHVSNLEWVTNSENQKHCLKLGLKDMSGFNNYVDERLKGKHYTCKKINQLTLDVKLIKTHDSLALAAKYVGVGYSTISSCCRGKCKTCKGYKWEYLNR